MSLRAPRRPMARRPGGSPKFATIGDLEEAAREAVDAEVWGYVQGAAGAEQTAHANEEALARWALRPVSLAGVRSVSLETTLLGGPVRAPFFVAPTAYQGQIHAGGERATISAAASLGVLTIVSTLSTDSLEEIARAADHGPRWFQLYLQPRFDHSLDLVRRAERAGYTAIVLTVDAPVLGPRDRQARSGFALDAIPPVGNGPGVRTPPRGPDWDGGPYVVEGAEEVGWPALEQIVAATELPVVVKGVLTGEVARRAVELGAAAVYVSNHGGRQLDRAPAALDALPEVVEAVGGQVEVYVDGGFRRGSDLAIALALGARGVGLGRPVLWALAAGGEEGVERYLRLLGAELANVLLLLGRSRVGEVDRGLVAPVTPSTGFARPRPTRSSHDPRSSRPRHPGE